MNIRLVAASLSIAALSACGPIPNFPLPTGDADGGTADAGGEGGEGAACTDLVNGGDDIPETTGFVFFEPQGGTVVDGTYHLTEFQIFAPGTVDPHVRRHALRVTGDQIEVVTSRNGEPEVRSSGTFTTSGATVTFTIDCPEPSTYSFSYHASEEQFQHVIEGDDIKEVHIYTKQ